MTSHPESNEGKPTTTLLRRKAQPPPPPSFHPNIPPMSRWHRCHDGLPTIQTKANRKRGKPQKEKEANYPWKKAIVRTVGEPKARQQIQRKEPPPSTFRRRHSRGTGAKEERTSTVRVRTDTRAPPISLSLQIVTTPLLSHILGRRDPD